MGCITWGVVLAYIALFASQLHADFIGRLILPVFGETVGEKARASVIDDYAISWTSGLVLALCMDHPAVGRLPSLVGLVVLRTSGLIVGALAPASAIGWGALFLLNVPPLRRDVGTVVALLREITPPENWVRVFEVFGLTIGPCAIFFEVFLGKLLPPFITTHLVVWPIIVCVPHTALPRAPDSAPPTYLSGVC